MTAFVSVALIVFSSIIICINCDNVVYPCTTPNNEKAYCISLFACPILMKSLSSVEASSIDFVRQSMCLGCEAGDFMVCCGKTGQYLTALEKHQAGIQNFTQKPTTTTTIKPEITTPDQHSFRNSQKKLLPNRAFCGLQHTDDRFYNETATALDEFPWLVHILFSDIVYEAEYGDRCTGVLISNKYVLTDAYCGAESLKVKLGQYSTNATFSCVGSSDGQECSEPTIEVRVAEKVRSGKPQNGPYDLTLLRLAETVSFTDYIRPICLPVEGSLRPPSQNSLVFSGWGASGPAGIVKKRLNYTIAADKVCYDVGEGLEGNVKFANVTLLCVAPEKDNTGTACNGEHGGPYMYSYEHQWFAEGIIVQAFASEGNTYTSNFNSCSNKDPVSGIRITPDMMNWILDSIYK